MIKLSDFFSRLAWQRHRHLYLTLIVALVYFLLHFCLRLWVSPALERDEAEQAVLAQHFALGYGTQPPLYTWLQMLFFAIFGTHLATLLFFKTTLLFLLTVFFFLIAKETLLDEELAMLATASLAFLPQIAWEGQRDLSHTVLATTMGTALLFSFFCFYNKPSFGRSIILGLCMGLGFLSKYNIVFLQAGLALATLATPQARRLLLEHKNHVKTIALTAFCVILPHLVWLLLHHFESQALIKEIGIQNTAIAPWKSMVEAFYTLFLFLTPFWFFFSVSFFKNIHLRFTTSKSRLLGSALLACFFTLEVFMVVAGMIKLKPRWFDPLFFAMPIVFFAFVHKPLATWSKKLYLGIFILTITGYLIGMPARVILSQNHGRFEELNAPVDQWVQAIAAAGFKKGLIIAESQWLAGNLKIYFPESQAYPAWADIQIKEPQSILVVWCNKPLPEKLEHQMKNLGYDLTEPQYIETPVLYGKGVMTLGMAFAKK